MSRLSIAVAALAALVCLAGCGPSVSVQNSTRIPVRVMLSSNGGDAQMFQPSPGESSSAEVDEGAYSVYVIPDQDWINYAKATRQFLNDQLGNSNLTGAQLLNVVQRLKDIAGRMQQYQSAAGSSASCSSAVSQEADGLVIISQGADGKMSVSCK